MRGMAEPNGAPGARARAAKPRQSRRPASEEVEAAPTGLGRILAPFPRLERGDRKELLERIDRGARADIDFVMMMSLSVTLASLGLLQDSTAVVIGAMLVAPLMGPLLGAGLALMQANLELFRRGLGVTLTGVAIGLAISVLFGMVNPGYEPSMEIEARGTPDLLDLSIAFASGMAAAWAMGRPNVAATLAGVAIAAALVPPLAVVGIAVTNGRPEIAANAAILLATNLVAIILGAALVFRLLGVHVTRRGTGAPGWARKAIMLLLLSTVLLVAPLLVQVREARREGPTRPLTYPVAPHVRDAVNSYVDQWPDVDVILMGRNSVEPESGVMVLLAAYDEVPDAFDQGLRDAIRDARGDDVRVRVFPFRMAREIPEAP